MNKMARAFAHITLLLWPTLGTFVALAFWRWLAARGVCMRETGIVTDSMMSLLSTLHGVISAFVIGWGMKRVSAAQDYIDAKDSRALRNLLRRRVPGVVHLLLGTMTGIILIGFLISSYPSVLTGSYAIAGATLALALYWVVAIELNDLTRGVFRVDSVADVLSGEI